MLTPENMTQMTMALIDPVTTPEHCTDKRDIAARFSAAAAQYDALAGIQHAIADAALFRLGEMAGKSVLDIGCGTGRNTAKLANHCAEVTGMDLAPGMVSQAQSTYPTIAFLQGDAEQIPLQSGCVECVFSSMALQWCGTPRQAISEVFRVLAPGGRAELAIMVAGSFPELKSAADNAGIQLALNTLTCATQWLAAVCEFDWAGISHDLASYTDSFDNITSLLKSINGVGAGSQTESRTRARLTQGKLQALAAAFPEATSGLFNNTYHILHLSLEKPL